jgi:hypothetical protein
MSTVSEYQEQYTKRANKFGLILLLCHLPFLAGVAAYCGTSVTVAVLGTILLLVGPGLLYFIARSSQLMSIAIAASGMGISALLIHLCRGAIEMHFHIFIFLAFLIIFGKAWPVLTGAAVIAVHHLAFWMYLPASVFNYPATFGTVVLHAFFVVAQVVPAIYIANKLGKAVQSEGIIKSHLHTASEHVLAAASQICASGESLSMDTHKQATILEETSAVSENISAKAINTAQKSKTMSALMIETEEAIGKTQQAIRDLTAQTTDIDKATEAMVRIIKVIDGIAFQTNILALNAAVEAARAGEAGLGFSVVADEVRKLAQNCADAAKRTSELIQNSAVKTKQGSTQLESVTNLIAALTSASGKVKQLVEKVSEESGEQVNSILQITSALVGLREITSRNAASAEENAAAGTELQSQAVVMQDTVQQLSIS